MAAMRPALLAPLLLLVLSVALPAANAEFTYMSFKFVLSMPCGSAAYAQLVSDLTTKVASQSADGTAQIADSSAKTVGTGQCEIKIKFKFEQIIGGGGGDKPMCGKKGWAKKFCDSNGGEPCWGQGGKSYPGTNCGPGPKPSPKPKYGAKFHGGNVYGH